VFPLGFNFLQLVGEEVAEQPQEGGGQAATDPAFEEVVGLMRQIPFLGSTFQVQSSPPGPRHPTHTHSKHTLSTHSAH